MTVEINASQERIQNRCQENIQIINHSPWGDLVQRILPQECLPLLFLLGVIHEFVSQANWNPTGDVGELYRWPDNRLNQYAT